MSAPAVAPKYSWANCPPDLLREIIRTVEQRSPGLWRTVYPRIYQEPHKCGSYYSPKLLALDLFGIVTKTKVGAYGESEQYEFLSACHLAKYRVPQFWLGKDMATAIQQTMPPLTKWDWYNTPLPYEAAVIHLPHGTLLHEDPAEGEAGFITYTRLRKDEEHKCPFKNVTGFNTYGSLNGAMTILVNAAQGGHLMHWNIPLHATPVLDLTALDRYCHDPLYTQSHASWWSTEELTKEDNSFMGRAMHLLFGTLLLMNARPDLVTTARLEKRVPGKRGECPREFWTPNIIGEHYLIRRERGPALGGTHASPRDHWVRGHYREQAFGPRYSLHKEIWIEPYFVGNAA